MKYLKKIGGYNFQNNYNVGFDPPTECPMCHAVIDPVYTAGHLVTFNRDTHMFVSYLCRACNQVFISKYAFSYFDESDCYHKKAATLEDSYPNYPKNISFPSEISDLSPRFVKIYNQASVAESFSLDEVAGIGYRKALEFLAKDYAIHLHPDKEAAVKGLPLSKVINNYIDDEKIKSLAKRASWLGNDETHYIRIFDGYDIETMKKFIGAMVALVNADLVFEQADLINSYNQ